MRQPVIEVSSLTRTYGSGKNSYTAVRGISFHVDEGEVFGLLGTNGAGKTSTLEIVEGLAPADNGEATIFGLDAYEERSQLRPFLGIMLQSGGLPQTLTVTETLHMWAGISSRPRPIEEVLDSVELTHRADVQVSSLSGGERRRLDLGCALLNRPRVLFLDEPTTGLDPASRRRVWHLVEALKEDGTTIVLTTHYLEEAEALCDRIAIMHEGDIRVEGSVAQLAATIASTITFKDPHTQEMVTKKSHDLQRDTYELLSWAEENNLVLENFSARPSNLDQVFFSITDAKERN